MNSRIVKEKNERTISCTIIRTFIKVIIYDKHDECNNNFTVKEGHEEVLRQGYFFNGRSYCS